jgi:hypothetical protein
MLHPSSARATFDDCNFSFGILPIHNNKQLQVSSSMRFLGAAEVLQRGFHSVKGFHQEILMGVKHMKNWYHFVELNNLLDCILEKVYIVSRVFSQIFYVAHVFPPECTMQRATLLVSVVMNSNWISLALGVVIR